MTRLEAEKIIERHRNETYYAVSVLQVGEVEILNVGENGFAFKRKTDYVETFGVYEEFRTPQDIHDVNAYSIAEVVTKRFK